MHRSSGMTVFGVTTSNFFREELGYRRELISFVEQNRSKLDHLLYDAGFDYRMGGKLLVILKSGYYGIF